MNTRDFQKSQLDNSLQFFDGAKTLLKTLDETSIAQSPKR